MIESDFSCEPFHFLISQPIWFSVFEHFIVSLLKKKEDEKEEWLYESVWQGGDLS